MITDLVNRIIAAKAGDTEFILSNVRGRDCWFAAIGNDSEHVCLGEGISYSGSLGADFYAEGQTPEEALEALLAKVSVTTPA
jgi:hypothetical protein